MEKQSQIQCEGFGGYPMISNISASIKERNSECIGSDETTDCFSIVKELEVIWPFWDSITFFNMVQLTQWEWYLDDNLVINQI